MDHYSLQNDEVVLYEGKVNLIGSQGNDELILTNINIVIITKIKKIFQKEQVEVKTFSVENVKVFNDAPQIKQSDTVVEVYLTDAEIKLGFDSKLTARKFVSKAVELITGKSTSVRGAAKIKGAVGLVDDTLGIDTIGTIKNVMENGIVRTALGGIGKKNHTQTKTFTTSETIKETLSFTKGFVGKKGSDDSEPEVKTRTNDETSTNMSYDEQIATVKKLKELLDADILSQEEFETKKKQILGL